MNAAPEMDPRELRAMIAAARRLRAARMDLVRSHIRRMKAELAAIRREDERLSIAAIMQRRSIDPANPFRAAQIAADVADLIPRHAAIDAALAEREAEAAERAARSVLPFPPPQLAPKSQEASP